MLEKHKEEWEKDCMKWRGRVLTGKYSHWCFDFDALPVDETMDEWSMCNCYSEVTDKSENL